MIIKIKSHGKNVAGTLLLFASVAVHPHQLWADTRLDAQSVRSSLQHSRSARLVPDEINNAEATFDIAEQYFRSGNTELAEQYYLLAIQKARIILASVQDAESVQPVDETAPAPIPTDPIFEQQPPLLPADEIPQQPIPEPVAEPMPEPVPAPVLEPGMEPPPSTDVQGDPPTLPEPSPTPLPESKNIPGELRSEKLVGAASTYTVVKGDTIRLIAAKLGVSRQHIIRHNRLDEKAYLKVGRKLAYNNRKIVPQRMKDGIVVNIPDRTLYFFKQGKVAISLPVALGVPITSDKYDWKTPTGKFKVIAKMKDPTWSVPPSIQSEMEEKGKEVLTSVPPGPTNPLGKFAIKTSIPGILIHSTTKPWSIYSFASHGCIRVYPEQMEEFFKEVPVNTLGEIIYKPVKLAITEHGRIFLEVHRDIYNMSSGLEQEARQLIAKNNLTHRIDWKKVESIVQRKSGTAEDITL